MKELLYTIPDKDLRWDYFRCGGKGGQKQNKTDSGARVTHLPSGITGESREERQQIQNRRIALAKLANNPRFVLWCKMHVAANREGFETIAKKIDEMMTENNLKIETAPDCVPSELYRDVDRS